VPAHTGHRGLSASAALLALVSLLSACAPRLSEDVRTRIDGAYLVIENRSGGDVHLQLTASPRMQAYLPLSLPGNRLSDGRFLRHRIGSTLWGQQIELHWWRPGEALDASGIRGPDRVRRLRVQLTEPAELPLDDLAVRACVAGHQAQGRWTPRTEAGCIEEAERCLNTEAGLCASMLHGWRRVEQEARAAAVPRP
jgi:hypothetical protein